MIKVNVEDHIKKNLYYSATKPNLGPKKYTILKKKYMANEFKILCNLFRLGYFFET